MNDEKLIVNNTNKNPSSFENGFSFVIRVRKRTGLKNRGFSKHLLPITYYFPKLQGLLEVRVKR